MRLRTAKKIMDYNHNRKLNMHRFRYFVKLRPAYVNKEGITVHPSWHDIDIVARASIRLLRWRRKGGNQ